MFGQSEEIIDLLILAGADATLKNAAGRTALDEVIIAFVDLLPLWC